MTKEMYEGLLERNKLQISELNTLTEEALADYNKVWTDMEEGIAYCYSHPCKLDKKKK